MQNLLNRKWNFLKILFVLIRVHKLPQWNAFLHIICQNERKSKFALILGAGSYNKQQSNVQGCARALCKKCWIPLHIPHNSYWLSNYKILACVKIFPNIYKINTLVNVRDSRTYLITCTDSQIVKYWHVPISRGSHY